MPENKESKPSIPDLKIRVELLKSIFTSNAVHSGVKKKTIEKWFRENLDPSLRSLRALTGAVGITVADFTAPLDELPEILAEIKGHNFSQNQIERELQRLKRDEQSRRAEYAKAGLGAALWKTIGAIGRKNMEDYSRIHGGYYWGSLYWIEYEKGEKYRPKSAQRFLLKIDDTVDEESGMIKAWFCHNYHLEHWVREGKTEDPWGFQGVMIPLSNSLHFIFEPKYLPHSVRMLVFMVCRPDLINRLIGIITGELTDPFIHDTVALPASSRVLFEKIPDQSTPLEELLNQVGPLPDELKEAVEDEIRNEISDEYGVLTTP